jgi:hypothetical protein
MVRESRIFESVPPRITDRHPLKSWMLGPQYHFESILIIGQECMKSISTLMSLFENKHHAGFEQNLGSGRTGLTIVKVDSKLSGGLDGCEFSQAQSLSKSSDRAVGALDRNNGKSGMWITSGATTIE